jgi:uncharacterized damage-inducible protein DinB
MRNQFRNNGAIGAILDEYEKTLIELKEVISEVTPEELVKIADTITEDPECKSIQTVLTHIIGSGYCYAVIIRKHFGEKAEYKDGIILDSIEEYLEELQNMFQYNVQLFEDYPKIKLEEYDNENKILVRWGQRYDVEQLMEHAIVHILRHRRQIEKFLYKIRS